MHAGRRLAAIALALALATACGPADPSSTTAVRAVSAVSVATVDPGNAGGNKHLVVMTRNLYLGADIEKVMTAPPSEALGLAAAAWATVHQTDFAVRARAIAEEIAAAGADLVGLQEAYTYRMRSLTDATLLEQIDFVPLLLAALADRGLTYRVVVQQPHTDLVVPFAAMNVSVEMVDHDAILVRDGEGIRVEAVTGGDFETHLPTLLLGGALPVTVTRGWAAADVKHEGVALRFATAHLETIAPFQYLQAAELLRLPGLAGDLPVILVGDFNSPADVGMQPPAFWSYGLLTTAYRDAWTVLANEPGSGLTCCQTESLTNPESQLTTRIDLVLLRGALTPLEARVVGDLPADRIFDPGTGLLLWPSDHAGVVTEIRLEDPRFFALH